MSISTQEALLIARNITSTVREALIVLDKNLRVVSASDSFYRQFQSSAEHTEGRLINQLNTGLWDIIELRAMLESVILTRNAVNNFEIHHVFEDIGEKTMILNARYLVGDNVDAALILLAIEDVTKRGAATREKLLESELNYKKFVEELNSIIIGFNRDGKITELAKFAEENPYPVLRVTAQGIIIYHNRASKDLFTSRQCKINSRIPDSWYALVQEAITSGTLKTIDTQCGNRFFSLNIVPFTDKGYVNIYASEITRRRAAEEDLRYEREQLQIILDNLSVGIVFMDNKGNLLKFNKAALNWYEYNRITNKYEYTNEYDLYDVANREIPLEKWPAFRAVKGDYVKDMEARVIRKETGECMWISFITQPIYDSNRKIANILMSVVDITERKRTEEALRKSKAILNSIIDTLPVGLIMANANGKIIRFNEKARKIIGEIPETISGEQYKSWRPDTGERIGAEECVLARVLTRGEVIRNELTKNQKFGTEEFRYCLNNAIPLRDDNGRISGGLVTILDITERFEAETRLKEVLSQAEESRNILTALMKNIPLGIAIADAPDVKIRMISEYGARILGRSIEEFKGVSTFEKPLYMGVYNVNELTQVPPEKLPLTRATVKGENIKNEELIVTRKDGTFLPLLCNAGPIKDDKGNITGGVIGWTDMTEQRQAREVMKRYAEELAAANRDLESFSYSVSHDLRNPLSVIDGFVGFLIEDYSEQLDKQGQDYLRRIDSGIKKMQRLINDILSLSRIGRQEIREEDIDLSAIVRDFLTELKTMEPERRSEFIVEDNLHEYADPRLIHLALENLLRNAWKFTSEKEVAHIEFGTTSKDGTTVYYVKDNGAGFDPRCAQKIFEPFQRIHAQKQFGGTGVGLTIVQKVVWRHGGKVWAEGEVGKGATFYFTLS